MLPIPEGTPEVQNIRFDIPNRVSRKRRRQDQGEEEEVGEREPVKKTDAKPKGKAAKVKKMQKEKSKLPQRVQGLKM